MKKFFFTLTVMALFYPCMVAQSPVKVYPKEIYDVLNNPGIGFTTFQRFNGDTLNAGIGWTEGFPIEYQTFNGNLTNKNHPQTTIAYFRVAWAFVEPEQGKYNWPMIDKALKTAAERGQALMLRIAPYETSAKRAPEWLKRAMPEHANYNGDVPAWYRKMVGPPKPEKSKNWIVDPEDPRYVQYFGGFITALGQRYDGHPDLESVDVSIIGPWGEGEGTGLLTEKTRVALLNSYLDNFKKTPLHLLPNSSGRDPANQIKGTNIAGSWPDGSRTSGTHYVGYRIDCWGDYHFDSNKQSNWGHSTSTWSHMRDSYPREFILMGLDEAWKKAPVTFEICWTFMKWFQDFKWNEKQIEFIFDESLKYHISSFNAKSSPVPEAWSPLVDKWLNRMGYRFVVRQVLYPSHVSRQGQLAFTSLWENIGCAPIYKDYKVAVRLRNAQKTMVLPLSADIREWLPGNIVCDENLYIPFDAPTGKYKLEVGIVSPVSFEPRVKLAIDGKTDDGWYTIGDIEIQ